MKGYVNRLNDLMAKEVSEGLVKGNSALIIQGGEEVYFHTEGYANAETGVPMKRDTIIRLFSMSKPITAVAVMIAMEQGILDLNDPLSKYLPEYGQLSVLHEDGSTEPVYTPITLMHLMTMTSGIPYGENWEGCSAAGRKMQTLFDELLEGLNKGERLSTREVVQRFAQVPLVFQPGERWMYGLSADILGAVLEVASGMRLSDFLKQYLFDPLQMKDTGFFVPEEKKDRFAMSYEWANEGDVLYPCDSSHLGEYYKEDVAFESGGCGLVSTLDDYAHFALMLVNKGIYKGQRILSSNAVEFIATNHLCEAQMRSLDWDSNRGYGYGCLVRVLVNQGKAGSQASLGEYGWDGWTGNYVCIDPAKELVFLYFIQRRGAGTTPVVRKMRAVTYGAIDEIAKK